MESTRKFIYGLAICIGLPWFFLIVKPYATERGRQPVPYTEADVEFYDNPNLKGFYYPKANVGDRKRGEAVYARLGCAQCHTQAIRPSYAGSDEFKKGYGPVPGKSAESRQTSPYDYLNEDIAMIGLRRLGPDLANYGHRADVSGIGYKHTLLKLYKPQMIHNWSTMPGYPSLFEEVPIENGLRGDAIVVKKFTQIVPTGEARALTEYLLSLKRDNPLPISLTGQTLADKKGAEKK